MADMEECDLCGCVIFEDELHYACHSSVHKEGEMVICAFGWPKHREPHGGVKLRP